MPPLELEKIGFERFEDNKLDHAKSWSGGTGTSAGKHKSTVDTMSVWIYTVTILTAYKML